MKWTFIKIWFILYLFSFHFRFSFHFSDLNQNYLEGTIPTIGLMTSLTYLWEERRKKFITAIYPFILFFHFVFHFILVIFIKTVWMEQFQLKLDWWLHWRHCENKKKRNKWNIHKICLFFYLFCLIFVFPFTF